MSLGHPTLGLYCTLETRKHPHWLPLFLWSHSIQPLNSITNMNKTLHMRVLCDGKKNQRKGYTNSLNQFTGIYINFQILQQKSTSIPKCIRCKLIFTKRRVHKIYYQSMRICNFQSLQQERACITNQSKSKDEFQRKETSDKCMGKKIQEWVLIQKFHDCSSDV
jgi:hypothetical protein